MEREISDVIVIKIITTILIPITVAKKESQLISKRTIRAHSKQSNDVLLMVTVSEVIQFPVQVYVIVVSAVKYHQILCKFQLKFYKLC